MEKVVSRNRLLFIAISVMVVIVGEEKATIQTIKSSGEEIIGCKGIY